MKIVVLSLCALAVLALTGCNTMRGVGEDISAVGGTIARISSN